MPFEYDVFISYAHLDDEPLVEGERGWITDLHAVLEKRLAMLLGERPRIWRDRELRGNQVFDDAIARSFDRSALFLSVVTPRYVRSDYCRKELSEFCRKAFEEGGLGVEDRFRVLKVMKTPVEVDEQPSPMDRILGYEFYRIEPERNRLRELRVRSDEDRERFLGVLEDLAQEIKEGLELLERSGLAKDAAAHEGSRSIVYLAPTSSDRKDDYELVRRELLERGHTVLPDRPLPLEDSALRQAVVSDLDRVSLAVHLVGERHGVVPENAEHSVVQIQNDLAAVRSGAAGLERILWLPPGLVAADSRQEKLIETLRTDPEAQRGAELLETSVEELKAEILERLERQRKERERRADGAAPAAVAGETEAGPPWIYLMHTAEDDEDVTPLEDLLWDAGMEVRRPLFEGDEAALREEHEENLQLCDGFLVYYGRGHERWLRKMLADLKKAPGLGRTKPILAKAVWVAPPDDPRKGRFRTHEAEVLRPRGTEGAEGAPGADDLAAFLGQLRDHLESR
ncbi:MAG: TIR domain-containing protein [Acidobacteriota bacterium]